ncbi:T6SS immunity protein Tli4 family protein [Massilia norwichensis]|uniref:T6SS immunity protein Tli4 family protein n=1 Tax=Massilia norwichensis TaxID=1442366 RepID=A0ABT2ABE1_9BURK|nr:T6SS immunity protein Tli4 family protein [Massilia norwichensis]MCS0591528.1 T6SS immunity protein Tli4 family protein [Massilia norwichensis]
MNNPISKPESKKRLIFTALAGVIATAGLFLFLHHQAYSYEDTGVPTQTEMSPRLKKLFAKTKAVCFGRYVLDVPEEAQLILGNQEMPAEIVTHENAAGKEKDLVEAFRKATLIKRENAEFTSLSAGPVPNSLLLRYFGSPYLKSVGAEGIMSFVPAGTHVFEFGWGSGDEESADQIIRQSADIARNLRARDNTEVPKGPGACIDLGFIAETTGKFQEIFSAGVHFPSLPDVSFSVMSNKDASTDGPNGVGIIARHEAAMRDQGVVFPFDTGLTRLRMGKHIVNGWNGEEVLLRHNGKDGVMIHEFMWEAIGKTGDLRHPAAVDINLDTGVAANTKYAVKGSLTDDEAVALWDKLLSSLRFRD